MSSSPLTLALSSYSTVHNAYIPQLWVSGHNSKPLNTGIEANLEAIVSPGDLGQTVNIHERVELYLDPLLLHGLVRFSQAVWQSP